MISFFFYNVNLLWFFLYIPKVIELKLFTERTAAKLITEKADLESGIPLVNRTLN